MSPTIDEDGSAPDGAELAGAPGGTAEGAASGGGRVEPDPATGAPAEPGPPSPMAMEEQTGEEKPAPLWLRVVKLFSDLVSPTNVAIVAGLVVIGLTAAFGGLDASAEDREVLPVVADGEAAAADPFTLTVDRAFWSPDGGGLLVWSPEGTETLVVRAHVESSADSAVSAFELRRSVGAILPGVDPASGGTTVGTDGAGEIDPAGGLTEDAESGAGSPGGDATVGLMPTSVYRAVDGQQTGAVQPGMPQDYWLVWELPADVGRPSEVQVVYSGATWRASSLDGGFYWADRTGTSTQTLDVEPDGEAG